MKANDRLALVLGLFAISAACTVVVPGGKDGGTRIVPIPVFPDGGLQPPPPKPLEASILYVVNLQRSSANLADKYASIMIGFAAYMQSVGLQLDNMGVISTYADEFGPRLLLGRTQAESPPPSLALLAALAAAADGGMSDYASLLPLLGGTLGNISDGDLPLALKLLASSGRFDGDNEASEAKNVIRFGRGLTGEALPPQLGGIDRSAFFDRPHDLFLVVYLQPLPRHCAFGTSDCLVDGRSPADIFNETGPDGGAAWLSFSTGSISPQQVVHVAIDTTEGEPLSGFRTRCAAVAGFPANLFDVIEPSPNAYFGPLTAALNAANHGTGHIGDLCELIGTAPDSAIRKLGNSVAAVAGTH